MKIMSSFIHPQKDILNVGNQTILVTLNCMDSESE